MERFAKIVNGYKPSIFEKRFILDISQGSECASALMKEIVNKNLLKIN